MKVLGKLLSLCLEVLNSRALLGIWLLLPSLTWAQGYCPAIDFLSAREFQMYGNQRLYAPLVREPDGSYTQYPHQYVSPYRRFPGVPNAQDQFAACLPPAANPGPMLPVAGRRPGEGSAYAIMFPDAGNGLAAGGWTALTGEAIQWLRLNANYDVSGPRIDYTVGERSTQLPGDFNGDGNPDVAVLGYTFPPDDQGFISVLLSNGDGTLQQPVKTSTGTSSLPVSAAAGDFNKDGRLDLVVGLQQYVAILAGKGDGTFAAPVSILDEADGRIHSADFNGDGRPDVAVALSSGEVAVLTGNGSGTFNLAGRYGVSPLPQYVTSGDFDRDGHLDLAVSGFMAVSVLRGNGNGTFGAARHWVLGHQPKTIVVADVNHDGAFDIVAGEGFDQVLMPVVDTGYMGILLGNGDGTFIGAELTLIDSGAGGLAMGDFNGDGRLDAVTSRGVVYQAGANGGFSQTRTLAGSGAVAAGRLQWRQLHGRRARRCERRQRCQHPFGQRQRDLSESRPLRHGLAAYADRPRRLQWGPARRSRRPLRQRQRRSLRRSDSHAEGKREYRGGRRPQRRHDSRRPCPRRLQRRRPHGPGGSRRGSIRQ